MIWTVLLIVRSTEREGLHEYIIKLPKVWIGVYSDDLDLARVQCGPYN